MSKAIRRDEFDKVMGEKEAELEKEMASLEKPTEEKPAASEKPAVEEAPKPEADQEKESLKAQIAERDSKIAALQQKLDKQSGEFGATLDQLRNQVRTLTEATSRIEQGNKAAKEAPKKVEPPEHVTSEEMRKIDPEGTKAIEDYVAWSKAKIAELEEKSADVSERAKAAQMTTQQRAVAQYNSDILNKHPDAEAVFDDPKFQSFISTPDKFGRRLSDLIDFGVKNLNPEYVIAAISEYKGQSAKSVEQADAEKKAKEDDEAKKKADESSKLKSHGSPSAAASGKESKPSTAEDELAKRQARMKDYDRKIRTGLMVTKAEMEQAGKDEDAQMEYELSLRLKK